MPAREPPVRLERALEVAQLHVHERQAVVHPRGADDLVQGGLPPGPRLAQRERLLAGGAGLPQPAESAQLVAAPGEATRSFCS